MLRLSNGVLLRRSYSTASGGVTRPYIYTPLSSTRSLLSIKGKDSVKFLQGLISNDVRKLSRPLDSRVIYAALLQADGRYMSDIFLHKHPRSDDDDFDFLLDHPSSQTVQIRNYLKRHVLRSKLKLAKEPESDYEVVQIWKNPQFEEEKDKFSQAENWLNQQQEQRGWGRDPRLVGMGWRIIAEKGLQLPSDLFSLTTREHYHLHRLTHTIPENPIDFPNLPLEANLELMNGVDYKKGCYVGQELTARTYFKGVVRKRGVGIRLFRQGEDVPESFLPSSSSLSSPTSLIPSPNLYPTPPPGSILTPLTTPPPPPPSSSSSSESGTTTTTTTSKRAPRAPRPAGKLGSTLPVIASRTGSTLTLGFASLKIDSLDQVFKVTLPTPTSTESEVEEKVDEGQGQDGEWFAKGFMSDWVEFKLEEQEISKGV